jgi:hypothetical protein
MIPRTNEVVHLILKVSYKDLPGLLPPPRDLADQHEDSLFERAFGVAIDERNFPSHKGTGGKRYRKGLDLQAPS